MGIFTEYKRRADAEAATRKPLSPEQIQEELAIELWRMSGADRHVLYIYKEWPEQSATEKRQWRLRARRLLTQLERWGMKY